MGRLVTQWSNDPNFSHGFFVPLFSLLVLWQDRKRLARIEPAPSWTGLPILVSALLMFTIGVLGAELFFSRVSFLFLLAGLVISTGGWRLFRAVLFPWAFLILMIPVPQLIFQKVTFPLQLLASKVAAVALPIAGVPVLREGNVIVLPAMPLEVAEACSGIRSLLSLVTLAVIYGYLMDNRKWVRVLLACSAVPIAVAANSFRIVGTGLLVQYWDPDKAEGFFHTFSGWLIFVVSLVMLLLLHRVVVRLWGSGDELKQLRQGEDSATHLQRETTPASPFLLVTALVFMTFTAVLLQAHSKNEVFPSRDALNSLPSRFGPWTGHDLAMDQQTLDILGAGEFLLREYENAAEPQPNIGFFIAYFPSQRAGDTIHSPSHCLPGAGWVPTQRQIVQISNGDGTSFPANRYVVSKGGDRELVFYWFLAHNRAVASEYSAKYYLVADSIRMNRSDGALIRLTSPMFHGETVEAAQARVLAFGSNVIPILNRYIPR